MSPRWVITPSGDIGIGLVSYRLVTVRSHRELLV